MTDTWPLDKGFRGFYDAKDQAGKMIPPRMRERRSLGTMVTHGFVEGGLECDLGIARSLGASMVEILPDWRSLPDPKALGEQVRDAGLHIHSAHGCWGGQAIRASRVDLGALDESTHSASVDDLRLCVDWLAESGGIYLVIHPGGLSEVEDFDRRRAALARGLGRLSHHARGTGIILCVENMPTGVYPGSRMMDLVDIVAELNQPDVLGLALDTGHANITSTAATETMAAGQWLFTTHVHDNDGRADSHLPPGSGTVDWDAWSEALDRIGYAGPVMLECVRHLRKYAESLDEALMTRLDRLTRIDRI